ncbi:hypothetical protein AX14_000501 [Amanita brunnescens Koide BX004]|nr:hypothetical protein AX14_000549 [Amanita brunnescens Koide BX004]KAF8736327.1 hypothetical protein AX14_000501 [Amanita brunnescens Koide BX004]
MDAKIFAAFLAVAIGYNAPFAWKAIVNNRKLKSIPSIGPDGLLTSFIGALHFLKHAPEMAQEGYNKYRGSFFKLPTMSNWMIVVSGTRFIEDIRNASEEYLSNHEAIVQMEHLDVVIGPESVHPFHANVIRHPLTQNIRPKFADIQDEISTAFSDNVRSGNDNEWIKVNAYSTVTDIVCRTTNRMFVGLPLARDPDFLSLTNEFGDNVVKAGNTVKKYPSFLRLIVSGLFANVSSEIKRGMRHLEPLIKERLEQKELAPNDLISWLLEAAPEDQQHSVRSITIGILFASLGAIQTATMSFTYVLYDLAAHPEYVQSMREEVEAVLQEDGWTQAAIDKLSKVDSFVKESLRLSVMDVYSMTRYVVKDFTFSDGTTIPAGNMISVPLLAIHLDPEIYSNPRSFDGFRFEKMRREGGENAKHKFASLALDYLVFGHGRQACPGRFFAAAVLKTMLAYVLLNYDVKMANNGGRPGNIPIGSQMMPDPTAEVLFRKRINQI